MWTATRFSITNLLATDITSQSTPTLIFGNNKLCLLLTLV